MTVIGFNVTKQEREELMGIVRDMCLKVCTPFRPWSIYHVPAPWVWDRNHLRLYLHNTMNYSMHKMHELTTISVSRENYLTLEELGGASDSFNDVISERLS
jgi:hypothetical protein